MYRNTDRGIDKTSNEEYTDLLKYLNEDWIEICFARHSVTIKSSSAFKFQTNSMMLHVYLSFYIFCFPTFDLKNKQTNKQRRYH